VKRVVAILLLVLISRAHASAEQLPIRTYTTADGLARDSVHKIVSVPLGYLWFCTADGLSRFDGYEFVNYTVAQGLPHRVVYDLLITAGGDYWLATAAGLVHFNPRATTPDAKFETYVSSQRSGSELIATLYQDSAGTIWLGTDNGLHALRQSGGDWQIEYVSLGEKTDQRERSKRVAAFSSQTAQSSARRKTRPAVRLAAATLRQAPTSSRPSTIPRPSA
jgi:ligand-binding sensor domain-containing protein